MNLQQINYLCAVVDHGLNVSDRRASAVHLATRASASRSGSSRTNSAVQVFVRQGKRLASLTPAGEIVVATARRALREIGNLKRVADEFRGEDTGTLAIATTHTQARYVLPQVLREFATRYPKVKVVLHQGNPHPGGRADGASGDADIGIATEALADYPELVTLPCYEWNRCVLVPKRPSARENAAAYDRGPGEVSDRHLRLQLHRPLGHQRGVCREGPRAQRRADRARRRRHQDLCRARAWASASWRRWPTIPRATPRSRCSMPRTCSRRPPRAWRLRHGVFPARLRVRLHRHVRAGNTAAPPWTRHCERRSANEYRQGPRRRRRRRAPRREHLGVRGAARVAVDARSVLDRHLPAGVPRHCPRFRGVGDRHAADAVRLPFRVRVHDAMARRAVRCAGQAADRAHGTRRLRASRRLVARSPGTSSRCGCFVRLQGLSAGTGLVVGRAIIRDRFNGAEAQRLMAQITLVFSIAPAVAPVIGGALLNMFGWRAIFWVLLVLVLVMLRLDHEKPCPKRCPRRTPAAAPAGTLAQLRRVIASREFMMLSLDSNAEFRRILHLHRRGAGVPRRPSQRVHLGLRLAFHTDDRRHHHRCNVSGRLAGRRSPQRTIRLGYAFIGVGVSSEPRWSAISRRPSSRGTSLQSSSTWLGIEPGDAERHAADCWICFRPCAEWRRRCRVSCNSRSRPSWPARSRHSSRVR